MSVSSSLVSSLCHPIPKLPRRIARINVDGSSTTTEFKPPGLNNFQRRGGGTYRILDKANAIDGYLIPGYDMLHTLGSEYLVNDLTDYVREQGVTI